MKQKFIFYLIGLICILCSCRKFSSENSTTSKDVLESKVRNYIENLSRIAKKVDSKNLNETLNNIDFKKIEYVKYKGDTNLIIAPILNTNVRDFTKNTYSAATLNTITTNGTGTNPATTADTSCTKVVFMVRNENLIEGNIVEISSSQLKKTDIEEFFPKILSLQKSDFNGFINLNTLTRRPLKKWGFRNNHMISGAFYISKPKNKSSNDGKKINTVECFDRFLVTTYYDEYGTYLYQTEEYQFFYCRDSEQTTVDFILNENWGGIPAIDSLCAQNQRHAANAVYRSFMNLMKGTLSDTLETGYAMNLNWDGSYTFQQLPSSPNGVTFPSTQAPTDGIFHTHYNGIEPFLTPNDISTFYIAIYLGGKIINPENFQLGVIFPGNKLHVIRIKDFATFQVWGALNLSGLGFGLHWGGLIQEMANATTTEVKTKLLLQGLVG